MMVITTILIKLNGKTLATLNQLNASYDLIKLLNYLELANEALLKNYLKSNQNEENKMSTKFHFF